MSRYFLPPVNRAMTTLDRSFFQKTVKITAAHVFDPKNVGRVQKECVEDIFKGSRSVKSVVSEVDSNGKRRMLVRLKPDVKHTDLSTVGESTRNLVKGQILELIPHDLHLKYENWGYNEIAEAILPEELVNDCPSSSTRVAHIVQLNLQNKFLPYKHMLGAIILDKNPEVRTVVNKIEAVGTWSEFRTFPMELLAGSPDTQVVVNEWNCEFHFDFAKVYWNSRLANEHQRIVRMFEPGEAVADVMAGVGPFAIPAAKNRVLVWANDFNPDAFESLQKNIMINKVHGVVQPFKLEASEFIRTSVRNLYRLSRSPSAIRNPIKVYSHQYSEGVQEILRRAGKTEEEINPPPVYLRIPPFFSHFVMNNPATAASSLEGFIGAYNGLENQFFDAENLPKREFPLVHLYIFQKAGPMQYTKRHICREISRGLGYKVRPEDLEHLELVKMVGPEKGYYCASFRLPAEVMFADVPPPREEKEDLNVRHWLKWSEYDDIPPQ
ncbi:tRNA methyltransferase [Morchella conica CCBAS932]|uniref:tRNA (guanine(37)-N1)-methyltransferase n=2 Tax=Morchella sect. Distantes TaxID=1051054 RepID=A0A3N4L5R1_9PEZI|nr:tRNA methyltransferase [Morchella conica CCBAS932]